MTTAQYLAALRKLGLPPYGKATCEALGLRPRQIARMASGESDVTETVALLLRMYLRHGLSG
jgi:plasmid maintenance system antidote protein VapI